MSYYFTAHAYMCFHFRS